MFGFDLTPTGSLHSPPPFFFLHFSYTLSWKLCLGLVCSKKFQSLFLVVCVMGYQSCSRLQQFSGSWDKMSYLFKKKKRSSWKKAKATNPRQCGGICPFLLGEQWKLSSASQIDVTNPWSSGIRCPEFHSPHEQHLPDHEGAACDISNRGHGSGVTTCRRNISMSGMLVNQLHFAVSRLWV